MVTLNCSCPLRNLGLLLVQICIFYGGNNVNQDSVHKKKFFQFARDEALLGCG
jgi:hypothetical protein